MFLDYVVGRLLDRKPAHQTDAEFKTSIQKGYFNVSTPEMISMVNSFQELQKNGIFNVGDKVHISFSKMEKFTAVVLGVHFYRNKVKYDLEIRIFDEPPTRIYNVDSDLVEKIEVKLSNGDYPNLVHQTTSSDTKPEESKSNEDAMFSFSHDAKVVFKDGKEEKVMSLGEASVIVENKIDELIGKSSGDNEEFLELIRKRKESAINEEKTKRFGTSDSKPEPVKSDENNEWQPTSKTLPNVKEGHNVVFVLATTKGSLFPEMFYFHKRAADDNKLWYNPITKVWFENNQVTHWMPLPVMPSFEQRYGVTPIWRAK